ncbi:MAG: hypothetical protein LBD13_06925 [Spirochaetaceae bacterium]|nr:hypothetical protein [Spirochaetaceae bacterium]
MKKNIKTKTKAVKNGIAALAAGLLLFSCDIEIPEKITIKSSPAVRIPLGAISAVAGRGNGVKDKISPERIKAMIESDGSGLKAYQYNKPASSALIYLIHKPIARMNLDLTAYMQALDVPWGGEAGQSVPGTGTFVDIPLPLDGMADWVTSVTDAEFILKLTMTGSGTVSVRFSQGNTAAQTGDISSSPLTFTSGAIAAFTPASGMTVSINAPVGSSYRAELDFDWASAAVKTGGDTFTGSTSIDLGELTEFLGDGITFRKATGTVYVSDLSGYDAAMTLTDSAGQSLLPHQTEPVEERLFPLPPSAPESQIITGDLNLEGDPSVPTIDLTPTFNSNTIQLDYEIALTGNGAITKGDPGLGFISADMFIELPLEFTITHTEASPNPDLIPQNPAYRDTCLKLNFSGGIMPALSDDDLFGRKGDKDDLLNSIETVTIQAQNIRNTIIGSKDEAITLGVWNRAGSAPSPAGEGFELWDGRDFAEAKLEAGYPFVPEFEILVPIAESDAAHKKGFLTILRPKGQESDFDFFLSVEAKAGIEKTIDL